MTKVAPILIDGNQKREFSSVSDILPDIELCGRYNIPALEVVRIKQNYQSVTFGLLEIEGDILIDGQLIMEI